LLLAHSVYMLLPTLIFGVFVYAESRRLSSV
jgi:hypothetical protein